MMFELRQRFYFEAAHTLSRAIGTDASRRIHGHTYHAEVVVYGEADPVTGMLLDLGGLREKLEIARALLDHRFLDEVEGLGPATLENLSRFIWNTLQPSLPQLLSVSVSRGASGDTCLYRGTSGASATGT